mmetsp:Transcript_15604/g.22220  ORF Transcript_15604/g.22220 Transcript_15604/m.22220 type:complete len:304 (-) Transcript_15604:321-1232(-)|eukprot:CAMPEP_0184868902 /NCGR_PEP_ID=MMETSP0580-20130426/32150_1 /TAXON_ID=1118495 /ORGANISM="Dactyliosolen fragilissimus" /LENGTH=303 /DNA_ID=CAMNT_0027370071 /DNA_START=33 /DNA_END=944 /DNA_ORIENTATION=-
MAEIHSLPGITSISESFAHLNKKAEILAKECTIANVPSLDHLTTSDYDRVYEPSDDTFLLLDALCHEFGDSASRKHKTSELTRTTLEIGCGTGVCTIYLAKLLQTEERMMIPKKGRQEGESPPPTSNTTTPILSSDKQITSIIIPSKGKRKHHVTDVNHDAIRVAIETSKANGIESSTMEFHMCDLATPLLETLRQKVDVLIFNPPYVPTPNEEVGSSSGIEASWAGGDDGRMVIDRALPQIATLLSNPHGRAYIIVVDDNKPEDIKNIMKCRYGINTVPILRRKARNEFLSVLKMTHDGNQS